MDLLANTPNTNLDNILLTVWACTVFAINEGLTLLFISWFIICFDPVIVKALLIPSAWKMALMSFTPSAYALNFSMSLKWSSNTLKKSTSWIWISPTWAVLFFKALAYWAVKTELKFPSAISLIISLRFCVVRVSVCRGKYCLVLGNET